MAVKAQHTDAVMAAHSTAAIYSPSHSARNGHALTTMLSVITLLLLCSASLVSAQTCASSATPLLQGSTECSEPEGLSGYMNPPGPNPTDGLQLFLACSGVSVGYPEVILQVSSTGAANRQWSTFCASPIAVLATAGGVALATCQNGGAGGDNGGVMGSFSQGFDSNPRQESTCSADFLAYDDRFNRAYIACSAQQNAPGIPIADATGMLVSMDSTLCPLAGQIVIDSTRGRGFIACGADTYSNPPQPSRVVTFPTLQTWPSGSPIPTPVMSPFVNGSFCPQVSGVEVDPRSGNLFVTCAGLPAVMEFDGGSGQYLRTLLQGNDKVEAAYRLLFDAHARVLYVQLAITAMPDTPTLVGVPVDPLHDGSYPPFQVLTTQALCTVTGLTMVASTLYVSCQQTTVQTTAILALTTVFCPALNTTRYPGDGIAHFGNCGSALASCGNCTIVCSEGFTLNGTAYTCSAGELIGSGQNCVPNACTAPPPIVEYEDASLGPSPCASLSLPLPSGQGCTAGCSARHPGSLASWDCIAGVWHNGPDCKVNTYCACVGIGFAVAIGAVSAAVIGMFIVLTQGRSLVSLFVLTLSAADLVSDLLYLSQAQFYHIAIWVLCMLALIVSSIAAMRAAGLFSYKPKVYGLAALRAVKLDALWKVIGVGAFAAGLCLIVLPLWWALWLAIGAVGSVVKAMSISRFREAWFQAWTGGDEWERTDDAEIAGALVSPVAAGAEADRRASLNDEAATSEGRYQGATGEGGAEGEPEPEGEAEPGSAGDAVAAGAAAAGAATAHVAVNSLVYNRLLLSHLLFESLPQLLLQIINNQLLRSWTTLAVLSLALSAWTSLSNLYVFGYHMLLQNKTIDQVPNDLQSGLLVHTARAVSKKRQQWKATRTGEGTAEGTVAAAAPSTAKSPLLANDSLSQA